MLGYLHPSPFTNLSNFPIQAYVKIRQMGCLLILDQLRIGRKDEEKAQAFSRSQYEIYRFATKYNLPAAAVDELCAAVANLRIHLLNLL